MNKQQLLKKLHPLIWKGDDLMEQDDLFDLQELVDSELIAEAKKGNVILTQLGNGFIKNIKINSKVTLDK
jgi:hypothetical protein